MALLVLCWVNLVCEDLTWTSFIVPVWAPQARDVDNSRGRVWILIDLFNFPSCKQGWMCIQAKSFCSLRFLSHLWHGRVDFAATTLLSCGYWVGSCGCYCRLLSPALLTRWLLAFDVFRLVVLLSCNYLLLLLQELLHIYRLGVLNFVLVQDDSAASLVVLSGTSFVLQVSELLGICKFRATQVGSWDVLQGAVLVSLAGGIRRSHRHGSIAQGRLHQTRLDHLTWRGKLGVPSLLHNWDEPVKIQIVIKTFRVWLSSFLAWGWL